MSDIGQEIIDFHSHGDRNYCDDSIENPGIRMQDAISHYIHPSDIIQTSS
ncbi:1679_t:CDS:2 [Funneliformis geosporum]|uniref:1679_t:CDS:1 n=1 Tax=Funneliformis geosporum TaxID=1117311 RepID=A0A9W4SZ60_9GLOM|nr:1679_t:CDS:2 [Funneliformis geosporum]